MNTRKISTCGQCKKDNVIIAKTLPSSGKWCLWCNKTRLANQKAEKPGEQKKECPTKKVLEKSVLQSLVKQLDAVFSIFIRTGNINEDGFAQCCTCARWSRWEEMDNGHCFPRGNFEIRWDEINCHAQCRECNSHINGYFEVHCAYIKNRHGEAALEELEKLKHVVKPLDRNMLLEKIELYKNLNLQNFAK